MKKKIAVFLGLIFTIIPSVFSQNSYKETASLKWYQKGVHAFNDKNYSLARKCFDRAAPFSKQKESAIEKYKLLTALELNEKHAVTKHFSDSACFSGPTISGPGR